MGLADDIRTLQAKYEVDASHGQALAEALAEMIGRKNSKRLIWALFYELSDLLGKLDRSDELTKAAGGIEPERLGVWDLQGAVGAWLSTQRQQTG